MAYFNEGVVACLDNNNKDDFDVENILSHPLLYLLGGALVGQCLNVVFPAIIGSHAECVISMH